MRIKSLTYNINKVALAILALLEGEVDGLDGDEIETRFDTETSTFYNGRENGICITVKHYSSARFERLVIVFGENRTSDNIFVQKWTEPGDINPPILQGLTDEAYNTRKCFAYNEIYPPAEYIRQVIIDYCFSLTQEQVI